MDLIFIGFTKLATIEPPQSNPSIRKFETDYYFVVKLNQEQKCLSSELYLDFSSFLLAAHLNKNNVEFFINAISDSTF